MCAIAQTAHTDSITTALLINMLLHFHYVPLFCRILYSVVPHILYIMFTTLLVNTSHNTS